MLVWFLYAKDRPGLKNGFDKATNDWYYISWYAMWVGNLISYIAPAIMWIPSYFMDEAAMIYGYTWMWAQLTGGLNFLFVFTSLICAGIEWKMWKEIWIVLVIYVVGNGFLGHVGMEAQLGTQIWYMWHSMERNCIEKDEFDMCIYPDGEHPTDMVMKKKMEDAEKDDMDMMEMMDWDM